MPNFISTGPAGITFQMSQLASDSLNRKDLFKLSFNSELEILNSRIKVQKRKIEIFRVESIPRC